MLGRGPRVSNGLVNLELLRRAACNQGKRMESWSPAQTATGDRGTSLALSLSVASQALLIPASGLVCFEGRGGPRFRTVQLAPT